MKLPARPALALGLLLSVGLLIVPNALSRATALPNACSLLPASAINTALGLPKTAHVAGKPKTGNANNLPYRSCSYAHAGATIYLEVAPAAFANAGFGGPPGMVTTTPKGFGPKARQITDKNPLYAFTTISFVKGADWYDVNGNGKVTTARVLALAHQLYGRL